MYSDGVVSMLYGYGFDGVMMVNVTGRRYLTKIVGMDAGCPRC